MIAIAWVDTAEGRRLVIRRAVMLMVPGAILCAIGRIIDPRVTWAGVDIVLLGVAVIVWAIVHRSRGLTGRARVPISKPCVVPGCDGTMHFQPALPVADGPHTLEWPWRPSWRCAKDPEHVELIATDEALEIALSARSSDRFATDSTDGPPSQTSIRQSREGGAGSQPPVGPPRE